MKQKLTELQFNNQELAWLEQQAFTNELAADVFARQSLRRTKHRRLTGWRLVQRFPKHIRP